jgi:uncharacterized protein YqhQ
MAKSTILVGGQAVMEGVMMRVPGGYATAVRRKDKSITVERHDYSPLNSRYEWLKFPVIRGVIGLYESMKIGMGTLQWSADILMQDEEENPEDYKESKLGKFLTTLFALTLGIGLFMVAPLWITTELLSIEKQMLAFNLVAGGFRILFFLIYLYLISRMQDVQRLFQYHGAEHKVVFNFESGLDLSWDNTKRFTTFHPRCGTSFLFIVMLSAIIIYALIDTAVMATFGSINLGMRVISHLIFLPVVAGISYEFIKITSANMGNKFFRGLAQPGMWLQRITTSEPDESQVEVAITSLKTAFGDSYQQFAGKEYVAEAVA